MGGVDRPPAPGRTGRWYVAAAVGGLAAKRTALALAGTVALAGCGGGARQDASEPAGTFPVQIVSAEFPASQHLARDVQLRVAVRNAGKKTIPDVALTVENHSHPGRGGAFGEATTDPEAADPSREIWILNGGPPNGGTAYVGTWALGRLAPRKVKTFLFKLTPARAGTYRLDYRVAAGLTGKAKASLSGGGPAKGSFDVSVSRTPGGAVTDTRGGG